MKFYWFFTVFQRTREKGRERDSERDSERESVSVCEKRRNAKIGTIKNNGMEFLRYKNFFSLFSVLLSCCLRVACATTTSGNSMFFTIYFSIH